MLYKLLKKLEKKREHQQDTLKRAVDLNLKVLEETEQLTKILRATLNGEDEWFILKRPKKKEDDS